MLKLNNNKLWDFIDWGVIIFAILTLICNLIPTKYECFNNTLCFIAGIIGLCYLFASIPIFICNGPKFDWYLISGHFLRKVCCFILLTPFLLVGISTFFIESPKELVFEENLYRCSDNELSCKIKHKQESPNLFWSTYYHFIDPGNQHMTTSERGRGWSALIAILGVFLLNGLLVSSIVGWIDSRKEKWLKGGIKYPCFLRKKKHYVIIGGNDMAFGIVRQIFLPEPEKEKEGANLPYILIQTTRNVEKFRRELFSTLTKQQQQHIIIFYGSRTSEEDLENLCLQQAIEVYILGEQTRTDELEPYHDTINIQCFDLINKIAQSFKGSKECIKCYVMFEYQTSFAAFQSSNQPRIVHTKEGKELLSFIPFSPYESWAQIVLVNGNITIPDNINSPVIYNNIVKNGISYNSNEIVHIIIVGMSKMGTAMAVETAHMAHFPNFVRDNSKRTKITFIDKNAREESDFFIGRFPDLFKLCKWTDVDGNVHNEYAPVCDEYKYFENNFLDIEWEFRSGGVESKGNREYIESCFNESRKEIVTIAICLPWPHQSLAAALYLPKVAIRKANDIWVYQPQSGELLIDINKTVDNPIQIWEQTTYGNLKPFGMLNMGFDADLLENEAVWYCSDFWKAKDVLVKKAEESLQNKLKQENNGEKTCYWDCWNTENVESEVLSNVKPSIGKLWAIWSNIYQINTIKFKMRSLASIKQNEQDKQENQKGNDSELSLLNRPDVKELFAKVEHNRWNVEKLIMGYKPLENHTLDKDEMETIKQYFEYIKDKPRISGEQKKCIQNQLDRIHEGINEKDIYYDWKEKCFAFKDIKGFYKDGPMKVHPNLCPFECLPMDDKNYDICFTLAMPFLREKAKNKRI